MNIQEENILRRISLVEIGHYDSREIIGAYTHENIAQEILNSQWEDGRILNFELETQPNLFKVYEQYKHEDKLSETKERILSSVQFRDFIKYNPCKFRISWRKGYKCVLSETPREFGHFNAWGFTKEECEKNMSDGLKECEEYELY